MTDKTNQTRTKRLSIGWRRHIRRLKATARKAGTPYRPLDAIPVPAQPRAKG